jgi:hypothetical protein
MLSLALCLIAIGQETPKDLSLHLLRSTIVAFGPNLISDDGTVLVSYNAWDVDAAVLNVSNRKLMPDFSPYAVFTEEKPGQLVFTTRAQGERAKRPLYGSNRRDRADPVGTADGSAFVCFSAHPPPGTTPQSQARSGSEDEYGFWYAVGTICPKVETLSANRGYVLPGAGRDRYILLETRILDNEVRLLFAKYRGKTFESGTLEYHVMDAAGHTRIDRARMSPDERRMQGKTIRPSRNSREGDTAQVPPKSADTARGVVMYGISSFHGGSEYYDATADKMKPLPIERSGARWDSDAIGGRIFFWRERDSNIGLIELFAETEAGRWEMVGPYEITAKSANGRFMIVHKPELPGYRAGKAYLVEPQRLGHGTL